MLKKSLLFGLFVVLTLLVSSSVLGVGCSYATANDSKDFVTMSTTLYNYTNTPSSDQYVSRIVELTPRLNFTTNFTEFAVFNTNLTHRLDWYNATNITIFNRSDPSNILGPGNYSYNATTSTITFLGDVYNQTAVNITYNRTFVKNVDNLVANNLLCTVCGMLYSTDNTSAPTYGQTIGVKVDYDFLAAGHGFVATWDVVTRTCDGTDISAVNGISGTKNTLFVAFGLLAIFLLITSAFALVQMFQNGSMDMMPTIMVVVTGGVLLVVAFVVIYMAAKAMGA